MLTNKARFCLILKSIVRNWTPFTSVSETDAKMCGVKAKGFRHNLATFKRHTFSGVFKPSALPQDDAAETLAMNRLFFLAHWAWFTPAPDGCDPFRRFA